MKNLSVKQLVSWGFLTLKNLKNPLSTMLFSLGYKKSINIKTKSLGNFKFNDCDFKDQVVAHIVSFQNYVLKNEIPQSNIDEFKSFILQIADVNNNIVEFRGIRFYKNIHVFVLVENFIEAGNSPFTNMNNKIVLDVGANIGDTPLYFAQKNCEVYAFEPIPEIYEIALKNIDLNPQFKDKIHIYNKAISDKNETIQIKYDSGIVWHLPNMLKMVKF